MITNYKINQPFTSNFSVEEWEKTSSHTWNHGDDRDCQPCWNLFLRRSQKSQWKENYTVATLWKPIHSGLDRFFSGSLQRKPFSIIRDYRVHKPENEALNLARQELISFPKHGRRGGLMVSALVSGSSGPGSSPGRGHCVVFLGKTLDSHSASLHPGV